MYSHIPIKSLKLLFIPSLSCLLLPLLLNWSTNGLLDNLFYVYIFLIEFSLFNVDFSKLVVDVIWLLTWICVADFMFEFIANVKWLLEVEEGNGDIYKCSLLLTFKVWACLSAFIVPFLKLLLPP